MVILLSLIDPFLPVAGGSFREAQSDFLLRQRPASFSDLGSARLVGVRTDAQQFAKVLGVRVAVSDIRCRFHLSQRILCLSRR
jgi:hypothetical protein